MSYRQFSVQTVLCNVQVSIELHKLLIAELLPFVGLYEIFSLACQEEHLGVSDCLWEKCYGY